MSFFELRLLVTPLVIRYLQFVSSSHGEGPLDKPLYGKVFQTVATGWWFSPWTLVSSTNNTDSHERPSAIWIHSSQVNPEHKMPHAGVIYSRHTTTNCMLYSIGPRTSVGRPYWPPKNNWNNVKNERRLVALWNTQHTTLCNLSNEISYNTIYVDDLLLQT